ncbi:MAG TPA: hypothetical protein VGW40_08325 [Allosphingosinicella sp.]|nr:hypothetical protein [Allosphingosinicella sp.]
MSKYLKLTLYLAELDAGKWDASFEEVEDVLGFPLPGSARQYPAWWANQGRAQSMAWQSAGWHTTAVDVEQERVTFVYVGDREDADTQGVPALTISDAKAGLAAHFGVSIDAIEIVIRG